jgi:UDP-N-acetylmuramate dehydrogenase
VELAAAARWLWTAGVTFYVLGGGSNILVSDRGVRGVVVLNRARNIEFDQDADPPTVWAESGANFGSLARQAARKGLGGLEWAAGIPGTLGGAVVGNAGAHGQDMGSNLQMAEILHPMRGQEQWNCDRLAFGYRTSALKSSLGEAVVLAAQLALEHRPEEEIQEKMDLFLAYRRKTQPPGASMGSMFKNPPGDYAGRLIEAAGLKGEQIGHAQISPLHGNFFVNLGSASAEDVMALIQLARKTVATKFDLWLELEVELVGDWQEYGIL